jgi:uncharacterized membrane protein YccC
MDASSEPAKAPSFPLPDREQIEPFLHGLKMAIAGVLAVFAALVLRLENPGWAIITAMMLMNAAYFGAIAEKSLFRFVGTVAGGMAGYLLTAAFQQNPWIYLPLLGAAMAVSIAMFGQSRYPYAFFLFGLTLLVVSTSGQADPDHSWKWMLTRTQEVCVGILAVMIVESVFFPRYARGEFRRLVRVAFCDLAATFARCAAALFGEPDEEAGDLAAAFPTRMTRLHNLLHFGARESVHFRMRLAPAMEILDAIARIAASLRTMRTSLPGTSLYRDGLVGPTEKVHTAIARCLDMLGSAPGDAPAIEAAVARMDAADQALLGAISGLRREQDLAMVPETEWLAMDSHLLALEEIRLQTRAAWQHLQSFESALVAPRHPGEESPVPPWPSKAWVLAGIKTGITAVCALLLTDWLQPPGAPMLVLGAILFVALNGSSPTGRGDMAAVPFILWGTVAAAAISVALLAATPVLSSYAAMNILIFAWLFLWGWLTSKTQGLTPLAQVGYLTIGGIAALNAQQPVPFPAIVAYFIGLAGALVVAGIFSRLLWPTLPQREVCDRLVEFLGHTDALLGAGRNHLPVWQRARLSTIPIEIPPRLSILQPPVATPDQIRQITDYLAALRLVAADLTLATPRPSEAFPQPFHAEATQRIEAAVAALHNALLFHQGALRRGRTPRTDVAPLELEIEQWTLFLGRVRSWMIEQQLPIGEGVRILGRAARYRSAALAMVNASAVATTLEMEPFLHDSKL